MNGRVDNGDNAQQATLNLRVKFHDTTVNGMVTVVLGTESIRLSGTDLVVTNSERTSYLVSLIDAIMMTHASPSLSPHEGSAVIRSTSFNSTIPTIVHFTAETPGVAVESRTRSGN